MIALIEAQNQYVTTVLVRHTSPSSPPTIGERLAKPHQPAETGRWQMGQAIDAALRQKAAINARDVEALKSCWKENGVLVAPGVEQNGRAQVAEFLHAWWEAFPDQHLSTDVQLESGSTAVIEGTFTGTQTGTLRGTPGGDIPPTDRKVHFRFVGVHEVEEGQIVRERLYFDALELLRQLGVVPEPALA